MSIFKSDPGAAGYQQDQLRGQQVALGKLVSYRRGSQSMLGSFYLGASLETGNVWQTGQSVALHDLLVAGSVFIGYDTALGPLYLGFGTAERGVNSFYFYLGRVF